jgi:hypothetical protein
LDQLDPANGARGVSWLPTGFSENVKIVVSTLVDRQYEAFPKLKVKSHWVAIEINVKNNHILKY